MRFNFNLAPENNNDDNKSLTPADELEWLPLQKHPVFTTTTTTTDTSDEKHASATNVLAWDGASRLYFWDTDKKCLHRISIRLGEPDSSSILAASPSKVLIADIQLNFAVSKISINKKGSAMILAGSDGLCVMNLFGRKSSNDSTIKCRAVSVGLKIYFEGNSVIRPLQALWHPYSDSHLGVLSSDSVFRLYDFSSDLTLPEQEYYLQPVELGRSCTASSICPVDFSFGTDHLWDKFSDFCVFSGWYNASLPPWQDSSRYNQNIQSDCLFVHVFVLFSDGAIYILCPIIPFGSLYLWESILEIYNDAETYGLKSANSTAVGNSSKAISWLEATFPDLAHGSAERSSTSVVNVKAHPHALFDASLALQGPLRKGCNGAGDDLAGTSCLGRAVGFLYSSVCKDSILATAWSGGQIQIDALADEIQPLWILGSPPRVRIDSRHHILGLAMICETIPGQPLIVNLDQPFDQTAWLGHPPPLLRLAVVDLDLPSNGKGGSIISMFVDSLIPERIYCLHDGGLDSIVIKFLPFTNQAVGKNATGKAPSVDTVLSTPICGSVALSDSFGHPWIVSVTASRECVVQEAKSWEILLSVQVGNGKTNNWLEDVAVTDAPEIISKVLLLGPKEVLLPQTASNFRSVAADSIEGRSYLHQYFKLFHENYVEYAHKVYFELKHHGPQLKRIVDDQHSRVIEAQQKFLKVETKQSNIDERLHRAIQFHEVLEERLQRLRQLPGAHKMPLSGAERDFKAELDRYRGVELDALRSSIDALNVRLRRFSQSPKGKSLNQQRSISKRKTYVEDPQISQLQSSIAKLSIVNSENTKKVKQVESALRSCESNVG